MLTALWALFAAWTAAAEPLVELKMRAAAPGEAVLVVVSGQNKKRPPEGTLGSQELHFWRARKGAYLALGAFDLELATGPVRLELELRDPEGGRHLWSSAIMVEAKEFPVENIKVEQRYAVPPKSDEERAEGEAKRTRRLYAEETKEPLFAGRFKSPIPGAPSSRFGKRRVFNGVPKQPHSGADLRAGRGEPVRAPARGRVALVDDLFYSGKTVVLDHGVGLFTLYAHLSKIDVKQGELVKQGQRIGRVGSTGRVTGPHLHWGVKLRGARVDPFSLTYLPLDRY